MVRPVDQRFPKSSRLRKRAEYLTVQRKGESVHSRAFVGLFVPNELPRTRLGITTTRRLGGAVVRNRSRRLVREAFRRGVMEFPDGLDVVVIVKRLATVLDTRALLDDLALLAGRVRAAIGGRP